MRSIPLIAALATALAPQDKQHVQLGKYSKYGRGHGGMTWRKPKRFKQNRRKELKARRRGL